MSLSSFIKELKRQHEKEHEALEFISSWDSEHILKTVCAFLNSDGGWIIVGHENVDLTNSPGFSDQSVDDLRQSICALIFPQPLVYIQQELVDARPVVVVNVLKGHRRPYSFSKKFYIRKGARTVEAGPDDVSLILRSSLPHMSNWEKGKSVEALYSDLDEKEIRSTIQAAEGLGKSNSLPADPKEFLSYFELLDHASISNGAIVLYAHDPSRFFRQCRVRITEMPEGPTGSIFSEVEVIEDNLFVSFQKVMTFLKSRNPIISEFLPGESLRRDRNKYPYEALRESIINAMVHRDYGDMSGEVTINIHPDKLEIINSGEIPDQIIKGKGNIAAHHSILRNPSIAHMFFLRGMMEKLGRGLSLIIKQFHDFRLKAPEWTFQNGYTKLTLYSSNEVVELSDRMKRFLTGMKKDHAYSSDDYAEFFEGVIKERTARTDLKKLCDWGWIVKTGDGPQTRYLKSNKKLPDFAG